MLPDSAIQRAVHTLLYACFVTQVVSVRICNITGGDWTPQMECTLNSNCTHQECCLNQLLPGGVCLNVSSLKAAGINWTEKQEPSRQSCPMRDHSNVVRGGTNSRALSGPPIDTHRVVSRMQCTDLCWRHMNCRAFNLKNSPGLDGTRTCELMRRPGEKEKNQSFSYWELDRELYSKMFLSPDCG